MFGTGNTALKEKFNGCQFCWKIINREEKLFEDDTSKYVA